MDSGNITITGHSVAVFPVNGEVWMTRHQIADLFGCFVSKVGSNIRAILKSGLFREDEVCRLYTCSDGSLVELYNLTMITALSFRIRSYPADVFREWLVGKCVGCVSDELILRLIQLPENPHLN